MQLVCAFISQAQMTRKHFEELAKTIAILSRRISFISTDDERLLNLLIDEISDFCVDQNPRFSYSRFKQRVLELIEQE